MHYTPAPNKKHALILALSLLSCSLIMLATSVVLKNSSALLSALSRTLSFITVFISCAVVSKYLSFTYTYILEENDLVITKNEREKKYAVCRIGYTDIQKIASFKDAKNETKGIRKLNYSLSISNKNNYCLFCSSEKEPCVIIFEPDAFFVKSLEKLTDSGIILP